MMASKGTEGQPERNIRPHNSSKFTFFSPQCKWRGLPYFTVRETNISLRVKHFIIMVNVEGILCIL